MESREPLKLVEGVMMAIAEHAVKQGTKWVLKLLIDIDCWNVHIAECALARFFHERRCDTRKWCLLTST